MNSLVDKLILKYDFENSDELKNENELVNTKLYKNLVKKYTFSSDNENEVNKNTISNSNNLNSDEKIIKVI